LQGVVNGPAEMAQIDGLDQVVEGAALHAKSCTGRVVHGREHEQRNGGLELHDLGDQLDPAHPRQIHIQEHAGNLLPLQYRQGFFAGRRHGDLVSLLGQELPKRMADRFLVVYDEQRHRPIGQGHTHSSSGA